MQAIEVIFCAPTNSKPIRYKVTCHAGTKFYDQDDLDAHLQQRDIPISHDNRVRLAAESFCKAIGWIASESDIYGKIAHGGLKNGNDVFVFVSEREYYNNTDYFIGG